MAGIAEHPSVLTQDRRGEDQLEGVLFPQIDDTRHPTVRGQIAADDNVGIEDDPHAYGWERTARLASSVSWMASSSLRLTRSAVSRICRKKLSRRRFHWA